MKAGEYQARIVAANILGEPREAHELVHAAVPQHAGPVLVDVDAS